MKKIISVLFLMFLVWAIVAFSVDGMAIEPDAVFPMCNQRIEWHYATKP